MSEIYLTGQLVCATDEQANVVRLHLPDHLRRTRAEAGCRSFDVTETGDPLSWSVEERFADQQAFELHQARVASSQWGDATAGIERRYPVEGLSR
ncbi:antibiotic biosynthesis monooxygenase [Curtobacterium sp. MCBD17_040]|uniref:putative quinol monooxygenase n=1 Tax=Curtobacterium sp. MCBD17_040 TaxID=2175674 RepID=UPI000DA7A4C9|nr:antibiotic biosynthesis monooxygenase [Curtobacterium sp. MCBD17_040]WIB65726.1 antibiotic biosynthesis monooxygenase [Curtobacterium sp. MCBD17_040]